MEKETQVETLVTLLFLSYSKLLQFIISVFTYAYIRRPNGSDELVWLLDGRIQYGEPKHIAMIIAALIIFVIVFIYTFVLLFWQLLVKCPNWKVFSLLRNARLIKAIELHHVPFNSVHRYWTGLLLLIRIIVYMVATLTSSSGKDIDTNIAIIILLGFLLIGKTYKVRVYKKWPLDVLESILIYLVIATAASEWYSITKNDSRAAVATTVVLRVVLILLIIVVAWYHIRTYALKGNCVPHLLRKIKNKGFLSASTHNKSSRKSSSRSENTSPPRAVHFHDLNRNNSILTIMGSPLERDYLELSAQQLAEHDRKDLDEQDHTRIPTQPTASVVTGPC